MRYKSGFVIAAVSSGSGKTTVTNGLLRAFKNRGFKVAPFKTGPDFIDTQFHKVAAGMESVNLDVFMSDEQHVKSLFQRYSAGSDVRIVEGVMGLFDGYDKRKGSAAHIAELTGLPVVLVINAASSAYSLAAVLSGFKNFDKRIKIAGVIFNNVASENHQRLLKSAAEDAGVTLLGCLKRNPYMTMPSRHLGLSLGDDNVIESFIDRASDAVKVGIDLDLLLSLTQIDKDEKSDDTHVADKCHLISCPSRKIALAYDEAFNFVYTENLRLLEQNLRFGGEIIKFSPLRDTRMPDADFLYLPGGYPELYAARLTANFSMRESIKDYIDRGGYAFAECGGMLYLCDSIDGYEMCGLLPIKATMDNAHLHLGYRTVKTENFTICGHEFHYSSVIEDGTRIKDYIYPARQYDVNGKEVNTPLYRYKNAIADILICIGEITILTDYMRIYTRKGDSGTTGIHGGMRVPKTDIRIETNGTLDELNSIIGIVRSFLDDAEKDNILREIQVNLMTAMSIVATPSESREINPRKLPYDAVEALEMKLDAITEKGCMEQDFVLPGGCRAAAFLHQARTVCRRAERQLWRLNEQDKVEGDVMRYVNRLSDLFFAMAREVNCDEGIDNERWKRFGKAGLFEE